MLVSGMVGVVAFCFFRGRLQNFSKGTLMALLAAYVGIPVRGG